MANLFEEFRKRYPLDKRVGEVLGTYVDMEAKQALIFAYGRGYHNGVAECRRGIKDPNPDQPLVNYEHSIVRKEDGYWLILRTDSGKHAALKLPHFNTLVESVLFEVTQGADAPKFGEDAQASVLEGTEEITPSGATEEAEELLEKFEHQITLEADGSLSDVGLQNLYCSRQEILDALTQEAVPDQPTIPTEPGRYVMSVEVEVEEDIAKTETLPCLWVVINRESDKLDYWKRRGATFRKVEE